MRKVGGGRGIRELRDIHSTCCRLVRRGSRGRGKKLRTKTKGNERPFFHFFCHFCALLYSPLSFFF